MTTTKGSNPSVLPAEPKPRWEVRYPGRLDRELKELRNAGVTPEVDLEALRAGRLTVTFDWPLDAKTTLQLRAVYPDAFPHIRPQVFLLSGLDPMPVRHRSPQEGNLCLLGRDTRQWIPSWTLRKLLTEQLEDAVRGGGDEDPQGEPADVWWNSLGPPGGYCLIDSDWDPGDVHQGTLRLRCVLDRFHTDPAGPDKTRVPIIQAVVTEVRDRNKSVLENWAGPLPPDLAAGTKTLTIPWVRLDETILPTRELWNQIDALRKAHVWLQQGQPHRFGPKLMVSLFAVAHPIEVEFGKTGLGWVFFQVFGEPRAFKAQTHRGKRKKLPLGLSTLRTQRAGSTDIGHRVPSVQLLRKKRLLLAGLGAIGAPVAIELARNGCATLHLIEHDLVEPGNTVRWPLGMSAWARPKLDALGRFLRREYPATAVHPHSHCLGQTGLFEDGGPGDDTILDAVLPEVDLVIDGSASHGVTTLLAERCRQAGVPFISVFATPTVEGGAVVRHSGDGGCPNCLEHAWHQNEIEPPPGLGSEEALTQPPGCAERTFIGTGYDLQELSLQAVRLAVETLSNAGASVVQTLSFVDDENHRCPPRWRVDPLPKHRDCTCRP